MKYKVNCALVYYVPRMRPMRQFGSLWAPVSLLRTKDEANATVWVAVSSGH